MHFHLKPSAIAIVKGGSLRVVRHPTTPSKGRTSHPREPILATGEQIHSLRRSGGLGSTSVPSTKGALPIFAPVSASEAANLAQ